ncbi:MAG: DUF4145 domain-containing protein, partial [Verrucomicrobiaceae bacterium]
MKKVEWQSLGALRSRSYTCGHCGNPIASERGWSGSALVNGASRVVAYLYICHQCSGPTFFHELEGGLQIPGVVFGDVVSDIPDAGTQALYDEARKCTGAGCYTSAVLACRKLLMHVAVSLGAKEGDSFISYVQFLADHHYVPPGAKGWVDHIRKKGNEATHEISLMTKEDAEELLAFVQK